MLDIQLRNGKQLGDRDDIERDLNLLNLRDDNGQDRAWTKIQSKWHGDIQ
jgi:hypothetical protein